MAEVATVPIKSPAASVVNWTQIGSMIASVAVYFGLELSSEDVATILLGINALVGVITVIRHTFFEKSVLAPSVGGIR